MTKPELIDDVFAVIQSSRLPMSLEDIVQDVNVMPIGRGEKRGTASAKQIKCELDRLIKRELIQSGIEDGGAELLYRLKPPKAVPAQKDLF